MAFRNGFSVVALDLGLRLIPRVALRLTRGYRYGLPFGQGKQNMCPNRSLAKEGKMQAEHKACSAADGVVKNLCRGKANNQSIPPFALGIGAGGEAATDAPQALGTSPRSRAKPDGATRRNAQKNNYEQRIMTCFRILRLIIGS